MLRVDFMFADSTTDFILVIFDDSSLLIGVHVWSLIFIMCLSLSPISTDAMALPQSSCRAAPSRNTTLPLEVQSKLSSLEQ